MFGLIEAPISSAAVSLTAGRSSSSVVALADHGRRKLTVLVDDAVEALARVLRDTEALPS